MHDWLIGLATAMTLMASAWGLLWYAARRLPPGLLKDLAGFIPSCVTAARRLRRDPRVPRRAKLAVAFAALWLISPIDLIPEFIPIIGPLDDVLIVVLVLRYAARQVPRDALIEAWPTDPRILNRLLGHDPTSPPR